MTLPSNELTVYLRRSAPGLVLLLLTLLLVGPLWEYPGLPNSADGPLHLHRAAAVTRSFAAGLYWPRWFPDVYGGLGAPSFHYYSPLFYWLTAALHSGGLALDTAAKAVITLLYALSGLGAWAWLRRLFGGRAGMVGATLFLSQPHIFREFYFQGDYPQLIAVLLLPICLWAYTGLSQSGGRRHWLLAPLSLALLVLAHNLTAMIGALFLALYWLALALYQRDARAALRGVLAALCAAALSAFFWMPTLGDVGLVQVQNLQQGFFDFRQYFLGWDELLSPIRPFDLRAANPPFPHAPGWPAWLAIAGGVIAAVGRSITQRRRGAEAQGESGNIRAHPPDPRHPRSIPYWGAVGSGFALFFTFLTTASSAPIWETLPGLELLQFPSRLLALTAVAASLAGAAAIQAIGPAHRGKATFAALALALLASAVFLFPRHPFLRFQQITPAQTIETERQSNLWGMTSGNEFLPRWADPARAIAAAGEVPTAARLQWQSPHQARIEATVSEQRLTLPLHYFPAWQVRADGAPLSIAPDSVGRLTITGADGSAPLELVWAGTAWQRRGEFATLAGLIFWLALVMQVGRRRRLTHRRKGARAQGEPAEIRAHLLILLLFLLGARQAILLAGLDWLQPYSPPDRVEGAEFPLAVTLGSSRGEMVELLGWDALHTESVQPGEHLRVRLYWQPRTDLTEPLHSFLHLYSPERSYSWAIAQNQNPGRIPTTAWQPALYYVDELSLPVPPDQPPGRFALAVGLVDGGGERLAVGGNSDGLALLGEVEVAPLRAGRGQPLRAEAEAEAAVGGSLRMQGYDLLAAPGGPILRTYWTPTDDVPPGLTLFVHLLAPNGERLAQWDGPPLDGLWPTEQWQPGALYIDRRTLALPGGLASGSYSILVGLYLSESGERLPFTPVAGQESQFAPDALVIPFRVP